MCSELRNNEVRICRPRELDRYVGLEARDVGLLHRAAKIDHDLSVGFLEIDQSGQDPGKAGSLCHGNTHRTIYLCRHRGTTKNVEAEALHLFDIEQQSASFIA